MNNPQQWPDWDAQDEAVRNQVERRITETYPEMGTLQDYDHCHLEGGARQYMLYFQRGRAAMQTGGEYPWENINIEYHPDIPFAYEAL